MDYEELLKRQVMKAHYYLMNGDPLKDVMDPNEIEDAISMLADMLYSTGTPTYTGEED